MAVLASLTVVVLLFSRCLKANIWDSRVKLVTIASCQTTAVAVCDVTVLSLDGI